MKTLVGLINELNENLITKKRADGSTFVCLKDNAPAWMKDIIRKAHGDSLPDDTIYEFIELVCSNLKDESVEATEDDLHERLYEIEPDCYTSDLTAWLDRRNDHVYYLTKALEQFDGKDGFQLLGIAQKLQIEEVGSLLINALVEYLENEPEEEEKGINP